MVTICDNHEQSGNHHGYPWISIDIHGYLDIYIYSQDPPCDQVLRALHSWCGLCFPSAEGIVLGVRSHHNLNAQCIEASHDCGWERNQLTNKNNIDIYIYHI
jgi:hypothetical protein